MHDDPFHPITKRGRQLISVPADEVPIAWWHRDDRYAERLSPGTKFADIIGEIDPAKLAAGVSITPLARDKARALGISVERIGR